jgi:hypothetical protein
MTKSNVELIQKGKFTIAHFSIPERIESKISFNRDDISQKFVFKLMEITHFHGFGCSPPNFKDQDMSFLIGTHIPIKRMLNKYINLLCNCLEDLSIFTNEFNAQLDFSKLDLTMFKDISMESFYPEVISAIRDQHHEGSWTKMKKSFKEEGKDEIIELINKYIKFEKVNKKDIGLVGHKLAEVFEVLYGQDEDMEVN